MTDFTLGFRPYPTPDSFVVKPKDTPQKSVFPYFELICKTDCFTFLLNLFSESILNYAFSHRLYRCEVH